MRPEARCHHRMQNVFRREGAAGFGGTVFIVPEDCEHDECTWPRWLEAPPYVSQYESSSGHAAMGLPTLVVLQSTLSEMPYSRRLQDPTAQRLYCWALQAQQIRAGAHVLPPCSWCGHPSGNWCEVCLDVLQAEGLSVRPLTHLCSKCDELIGECRICRLTRQVVHNCNTQPVHRSAGAYKGTFRCLACNRQDWKLQVCQRCRCARYCSSTCQQRNWLEHRESCLILRERQPLSFVYSWFQWRADWLQAAHPKLVSPVRGA